MFIHSQSIFGSLINAIAFAVRSKLAVSTFARTASWFSSVLSAIEPAVERQRGYSASFGAGFAV